MIACRTNISQFLRYLKRETSGPNSIYKRAGRQLNDEIWNAFVVLVEETPQWSGSTAASWRIGFAAPEEYTQMPRPSSVAEALQKGHSEAVEHALYESVGFRMEDHDLMRYTTQDIMVTNASPQFNVAEFGPLRRVNQPGGAVQHFMDTIEKINIK